MRKLGVSQDVPCGDQCEDCYRLYTVALSSMSWAEICILAQQDSEFEGELNSARMVMQGSPKSFFESAVTADTDIMYKVSRFGKVLDNKDVKAEFGLDMTKPTHRSLLPGTMNIVSEDGQGTEWICVVQDEARPHRYIEVFSQHGHSLRETRMSPAQHLFKSQSNMIMKF